MAGRRWLTPAGAFDTGVDMAPDDTDTDPTEPDPIDEEAAEIDPRSPEAAEQIEELKEDAEALGRDVEP
jgi:hypothetical protein